MEILILHILRIKICRRVDNSEKKNLIKFLFIIKNFFLIKKSSNVLTYGITEKKTNEPT